MQDILEMLHSGDFYGVSENIEIAKGKYKKPESVKQLVVNLKRKLRWLLRK